MSISKETEQKIQQLQLSEQALQNIVAQKQQFQLQVIEIESALNEIKDRKEVYKIIGNIMISAKKEDVEKDLKEKKSVFELRIKSLEKQEESIKGKAKRLQEDVLGEMKKDG